MSKALPAGRSRPSLPNLDFIASLRERSDALLQGNVTVLEASGDILVFTRESAAQDRKSVV